MRGTGEEGKKMLIFTYMERKVRNFCFFRYIIYWVGPFITKWHRLAATAVVICHVLCMLSECTPSTIGV